MQLDDSVIPIQKLVRVQLGSALLAAGYAAGRRQGKIGTQITQMNTDS